MKGKKILGSMMLIVLFLTNISYAKYKYDFEEEIIHFSRDSQPPICKISYSTEEWTNQNVIISITCDKEVQQVSGFVLSEDKKTLTKEVTENETGVLKIRDLSGNYTELQYEVANIDKEPPQIIGCENGGTYSRPLALNYTDNVEVKDILVDRYHDKLDPYFKDVFFDSSHYYGIDRNASSLRIGMEEHPVNTRQYRYYLNGQLYTTSEESEYIFTGLNYGCMYEIKVEALDKMGNVLDTFVTQQKTSYFETITSTKEAENFTATFHNLQPEVARIDYAVWNVYDKPYTIWYSANIIGEAATVNCNAFNYAYYPSYVIHAYMYDINGNVLDVVGFSIDFNSNYLGKEKLDIYNLENPGNYQIIVNDLAGNEIVYYIKVE